MNELLPEYAAGTLDPARRAEVEAHLRGCAGCRADLAGWAGLAAAARVGPAEAPAGPDLVYRVMVRSALTGSHQVARRFSLALIPAEARLLRLPLLLASALVMAVGMVLAVLQTATSARSSEILALVAPIVAAAGISSVYGPQRDPAFEVVAATPTAQRLILLIRIVLVFGYDLLLALGASGVVVAAGADAPGLRALVVAWLGPMALLSALCLLLVVWVGPDVAIGVALALWCLRVLAGEVFTEFAWLDTAVRALWSTNLRTASAVAVLVLLAILLAGRGEPVRRSRATNLM